MRLENKEKIICRKECMDIPKDFLKEIRQDESFIDVKACRGEALNMYMFIQQDHTENVGARFSVSLGSFRKGKFFHF